MVEYRGREIDTKIPQAVKNNCKQGLEWRKEYGRGGTDVGVATARYLIRNTNCSIEKARHIAKYFPRHENNKDTPLEEGNGKIAWALWGGDAGRRWSNRIVREADEADAAAKSTKAAPSELKVGDFVRWNSSGGTARGKIVRIIRNGQAEIPDSGFIITGTTDNPAALIRVWRKDGGEWGSTKRIVGHRFTALTKIKALEGKVKDQESAIRVSEIKSIDKEKQIVYGLVYEPYTLDSHGDMMLPEEIEKMAHRYMEIKELDKTIDVNHDGVAIRAHPVSSYIATKDDPNFSEGSWVLGVKVKDPSIWRDIKSGKLNGFSFEAYVYKYPAVVEYEYSRNNFGKTAETEGHYHLYFAELSEDGTIIGGRTTTDNGHAHEIRFGTATEEAGTPPHRHRFRVE